MTRAPKLSIMKPLRQLTPWRDTVLFAQQFQPTNRFHVLFRPNNCGEPGHESLSVQTKTSSAGTAHLAVSICHCAKTILWINCSALQHYKHVISHLVTEAKRRHKGQDARQEPQLKWLPKKSRKCHRCLAVTTIKPKRPRQPKPWMSPSNWPFHPQWGGSLTLCTSDNGSSGV